MVLAIDAPYRAEDAAIVPITIRTLLPAGDGRQVRRITLVIDEKSLAGGRDLRIRAG